jgi:BirA family biotin operon repressor/biotin-[acetyl-CoA-carboxylase] ligase
MCDDLASWAVSCALDTRVIGRRIIYRPSLRSTNDTAMEEALRGAVEGTVVIAGEQTAGRGRHKRVWRSPKGNISLSIILYPDVEYLSSLIMFTSLAVARSIRQVTGLQAQIKWPNDVLIGGKKVSGILIENRVRGNMVDYAVIGIGVNVNLRIGCSPELIDISTSLSVELGKDISLVNITRWLLVEMDSLYQLVLEGFPVYEEWRDELVNLGSVVCLKTDEGILEGVAESVSKDGGLMVRGMDGCLSKIVSGDIILHRHGCNPPSPGREKGNC